MIRVIYRWIIKGVEVISIVGIVLMVLFTAYEICMRELFKKPTIWTNEITSYLLVWVGLLAVIYAYDKGTHVSVDLIFRRLPVRLQRFLNVITSILMLIFALFVCIYGYKYWWIAYSRGWRHFGMLDVPMAYTRVAVPIAGLLLVFQIAISTYEHIILLQSTKKGEKVRE
ncbi:MAG: hypothetical protein DRG83_07985 [Deltaproteobacteria bacterium]|nr:MAG: hypothetical protein DRG83_07985 [Deltaproteobacteria bacterium]